MIQPDERETIISYNDGSHKAIIYTHDKALQRHIDKELGVKAHLKYGSAREYEIPKKWLKYPRKPSEKRREAGRQRFNKMGGAHPLKSSKRVQNS